MWFCWSVADPAEEDVDACHRDAGFKKKWGEQKNVEDGVPPFMQRLLPCLAVATAFHVPLPSPSVVDLNIEDTMVADVTSDWYLDAFVGLVTATTDPELAHLESRVRMLELFNVNGALFILCTFFAFVCCAYQRPARGVVVVDPLVAKA